MAKFSIAPAQMPQDRRRGDAHIVGYYGCCVRIHQAAGRGLRASGWGKERRARAEWEEAPTLWDKPMSPSTEEVAMLLGCAGPTGVVMVAPSEVPRNAEGAQSEGRAR